MKDIINICTIQNCGRKFKSIKELNMHIERRHTKITENKTQGIPSNIFSKPNFQTKDKLQMKEGDEDKQTITINKILELNNSTDINEIETIMLRNKNLNAFELDDHLKKSLPPNLYYLSVAHNKISNIEDIGLLVSLTELNISNNNVEDI